MLHNGVDVSKFLNFVLKYVSVYMKVRILGKMMRRSFFHEEINFDVDDGTGCFHAILWYGIDLCFVV